MSADRLIHEMFDVLDDRGMRVGEVAPKRDVHHRGLWHAGMNLCVTDGRGNIIQQKRGRQPAVSILPAVWDLFLVAGYVAAGETPLETLLREAREEIGLEFSITALEAHGLREVGVTRSDYLVIDSAYPAMRYRHRVFDHNFVVRLPDLNLDRFELEPEKVVGVRSYSVNRLRSDLLRAPESVWYAQHTHRPPDDAALYKMMLGAAEALTLF
jgi:8-oxo-dGTP pyrophosphatase MutT (NUDIX family)